jgi:hypothetical protein
MDHGPMAVQEQPRETKKSTRIVNLVTWAKRLNVHVKTAAEVSWPAISKVIKSSLSCLLDTCQTINHKQLLKYIFQQEQNYLLLAVQVTNCNKELLLVLCGLEIVSSSKSREKLKAPSNYNHLHVNDMPCHRIWGYF